MEGKRRIFPIPIFFIFLLSIVQVTCSGIIFSGANPIVLDGVAEEKNILKGDFKIGNPEASASSMIFSFVFSANETFFEDWELALLSPSNNTVLAPGEIVNVEFQCITRKNLPPSKYTFKIIVLGKSAETEEGTATGFLAHNVSVEINLIQRERSPSWMLWSLLSAVAVAGGGSGGWRSQFLHSS